MSAQLVSRLLCSVVCLIACSGRAFAQPGGDLCHQPEAKLEKWHSVQPMAGMTISLPPGFSSSPSVSHNGSALFYRGGRARSVSVGTGSGPGRRMDAGSGMGTTSSVEKLPPTFDAQSNSTSADDQMNEKARCTTTIDGRAVEITTYEWSGPTSGAGLARAVARFPATASQPERYITLESDTQSDVASFREVFWSASFNDAATVASKDSAQARCVATLDPSLASVDRLLDTSLVQMLVSNAAPPIPRGFEVISLRFNGTGGVDGISVAQSDFPDATQRQLTTLVASNLKEHDARTPSAFLLRIESTAPGLNYLVLPLGACGP